MYWKWVLLLSSDACDVLAEVFNSTHDVPNGVGDFLGAGEADCRDGQEERAGELHGCWMGGVFVRCLLLLVGECLMNLSRG